MSYKGVFKGNFKVVFAFLITLEHNSLVIWNSLYSFANSGDQISDKCFRWQNQGCLKNKEKNKALNIFYSSKS